MEYSSIGVSGLDLVFMTDAEREVFYSKIPLITSRELQTIATTLRLNLKAIESLNLKKDTTTTEFRDAYTGMQQFKQRFFANYNQESSCISDDVPIFDMSDLTSEFSSEVNVTKDEDDDLFGDIVKEIEESMSPLEELEMFIRAKGRSKDLRRGIDERVMENNFSVIEQQYNRIPLDVNPLREDPQLNDPHVLSAIRALSRRVHLCNTILKQMRQDGSRVLVDVTIRGRVASSMQRTGTYRRFSERRKTRDEVEFALSQVAAQLSDISTEDMHDVSESLSEFDLVVEEVLFHNENMSRLTGDALKKRQKSMNQLHQIASLYEVIKGAQMRIFKEIFDNHVPDKMDVINCSRKLATVLGITGLSPSQEITLIKSAPALYFRPRKEPPTKEASFVLTLLAMSLVSEKHDMITGVRR